MIRTIIIDDETRARETLNGMLRLYCPQAEVIAEFSEVAQAVEQLPQLQPQLVFLDVQLEDGSGFDILKALPRIDFKIIFVTAHDTYAVEAFRASAVDFLLKPVDPEELIAALEKADEVLRLQQHQVQLDALMSNLQNRGEARSKLVLKTAESIHLVNVADIIRCEAHRNYTEFHFADGQRLLVSKTLKEYDDLLIQSGFYRVHQSHLINLEYFRRFEKTEGGYVVLQNEHEVPVSSRKREAFLRHLETL